MPNGGTLTIATDCARRDDSDYVTISVSDTGKGINAAIQKHVFEPFFTTKEESIGTGLGLAMVHGIVSAHSGSIEFESAPGAGTTFSIWLPVADSTSTGLTTDGSHEQRGDETVLLAEDNPSVRELLTTQLEDCGYSVVVAADGDEAVRQYLEHEGEIDVAVLDLRMPHKSGREVCEEIRRRRPELPVVLISGNVELIPKTDADDDRMVIIQKPFSGARLVNSIRQVVDS